MTQLVELYTKSCPILSLSFCSCLGKSSQQILEIYLPQVMSNIVLQSPVSLHPQLVDTARKVLETPKSEGTPEVDPKTPNFKFRHGNGLVMFASVVGSADFSQEPQDRIEPLFSEIFSAALAGAAWKTKERRILAESLGSVLNCAEGVAELYTTHVLPLFEIVSSASELSDQTKLSVDTIVWAVKALAMRGHKLVRSLSSIFILNTREHQHGKVCKNFLPHVFYLWPIISHLSTRICFLSRRLSVSTRKSTNRNILC